MFFRYISYLELYIIGKSFILSLIIFFVLYLGTTNILTSKAYYEIISTNLFK